jgi:hypothetical protein
VATNEVYVIAQFLGAVGGVALARYVLRADLVKSMQAKSEPVAQKGKVA